MNGKVRRVAMLASAACIVAFPFGGALAQSADTTAAAQAQRDFDIPAQPLSRAAVAFSEQAGVQLVLGSPAAERVTANAVRGRHTITDALSQLVAGTGMSWRYLNGQTITIEPTVAAGPDGVRTFGTVQVEGAQGSSGFGGLNGFGAGAGVNGSSDVTATEGSRSLTGNGTSLAGKTQQSFRETTQSVNVITNEQIKQQGLNDLTQVLNQAPGITLAFGEAGSVSALSKPPQIISRGFAITTYTVDGGAPIEFAGAGSMADMSQYDHVEILRGSSIYTAAGDPGGTLNLQRKRPLDHAQLVVQGQLGSWNHHRVEADLSTPLAFDGHLRGRAVIVYQDNDFFYDVSHSQRDKFYGTLDFDLGPKTIVQTGMSYDLLRNTGINNSGLPRYLDGGDLNLPRSTCFCAPWAGDTTETTELFLNVEHRFSDNWALKFNGTRIVTDYRGVLTQGSALINRGDPTWTGSFFTSSNRLTTTDYAADVNLSGGFDMFGLDQKFILGGSYRRSGAGISLVNHYTVLFADLKTFKPSDLGNIPPNDPFYIVDNRHSYNYYTMYGNMSLNPVAKLHLTAGVSVNIQDSRLIDSSKIDLNLIEPGAGVIVVPATTRNYHYRAVATPSFGASYDILDWASIYASYNRIYKSTLHLDVQRRPLPPVSGSTWQAGIKIAPKDGRLNGSLAYFYTTQNNQEAFDPSVPSGTIPDCCYINLGTIKVQGIEAEVSGALTDNWQIQAGYTYTRTDNGPIFADFLDGIENGGGTLSPASAGVLFFDQQPKHQVKIWTSYQLPGRLSDVTIGGGFRLESARLTRGVSCSTPVDQLTFECPTQFVAFAFTQKLYTVQDLRVGYRFGEHWEAQVNLTNLADKRYYATAGTAVVGNFYGEPRRVLATIRATY